MRRRVKGCSIAGLCAIAVLSFTSMSQATPGVGASMDYHSWGGALLIGPSDQTIWGVRVGYVNGERYVTDNDWYEKFNKTEAKTTGGEYARISEPPVTLSWAKVDDTSILGMISVSTDTVVVVIEAYPALDNSSARFPYPNPANFSAENTNGVITGSSQKVNAVAGTTYAGGGIADITGRSATVLPASSGLEYFRLTAFSIPTITAMGPVNSGGITIPGRTAYMRFVVNTGTPLLFQAKVGTATIQASEMLSASAAKTVLETAKSTYEATRLYGTGNLGRVVEPSISQHLWMAHYNPFEKACSYNAGTPWWMDGNYNYWGWDENFAAMNGAIVSEPMATKTAEIVYSDDRVSILAGWYIYSMYKNVDLLRANYSKYKKMYPADNTSLPTWVGKGMDDTPMRGGKETADYYSIDMTCYKAISFEILQKMATVLGNTADAAAYGNARATMLSSINATFWNAAAGTYKNHAVSGGGWSPWDSPTSFYPGFTGAPTATMISSLAADIQNTDRFWGTWVIPTIELDYVNWGQTTNDYGRTWPPYCYWKGTLWPPSNYLTYEALKRMKLDDIAGQFALKNADVWWHNFDMYGISPENLNPLTGERSETAHKHQGWGQLFAMIAIKEMIDVEWWADIDALRFGTMVSGDNAIYNYNFNGARYNVVITHAPVYTTALYRNSAKEFEAIGGPCVVRNFKPSNSSDSTFEIYTKNNLTINLYPPLVSSKHTITVAPGRQTVHYTSSR